MKIDTGAIYNNLKQWNYNDQYSGPYKLRKEEAEAICEEIERGKPMVAVEVNRGDYVHTECPRCGLTLEPAFIFCPTCGQKIVRPIKKEETTDAENKDS